MNRSFQHQQGSAVHAAQLSASFGFPTQRFASIPMVNPHVRHIVSGAPSMVMFMPVNPQAHVNAHTQMPYSQTFNGANVQMMGALDNRWFTRLT